MPTPRTPAPGTENHRIDPATRPALRSVPMLQPSIQQLSYLVAVADESTFSEAAATLGVSTSALSQGLAELERRVGLELFVREGRRQVLRDESAEVLAYARRVVADTRDLTRWVGELRGGRAGRLRIGMIDAAAVEHFPDQLRTFRRANSEVELMLSVAPSGELLDRLLRGELDLAVVVEPDELPSEVECSPLIEEDVVVVPPEGSTVGPVNGWGPWVLFPTGSHTRALIERELRSRGARVDVVAESHQPEVLREMARLGVGWTVLPEVQAHRPQDGRQRVRPVGRQQGQSGGRSSSVEEQSRVVLTRRRLMVARLRARSPHGAADRFVALLEG